MKYFAIIGKNKKISLAELKLIKPNNLSEINDVIITFDCKNPQLLNNLGGIIKRGEIVSEKGLAEILANQKIIGTKDKDFGIKLKKRYGIKRFKLVDLFKTDKEIKDKGIEILKLGNNFGIIKGYQNIGLYEKIDFGKPSRSMKMGMMPAKLTHIMINIGLSQYTNKDNLTIYDPFSGSGTTGFLANHLGYNFIGSDINIHHLEINKKRRLEKGNSTKSFEIFQHDITKDLPNNTFNGNILIASEGRLGPIINDKTNPNEIIKYQNDVWTVYKNFIKTISKLRGNHTIKAVFTIPYYINNSNFLEQEIKTWSQTFGWNIDSIDEIYSRDKQKVGRKIIILY